MTFLTRSNAWRRWEDGHLWPGLYNARTLMLLVLSAFVAILGAPAVSVFIVVVVVPYNIFMAHHHRVSGHPHVLLSIDQCLAATCALISPSAVPGTVMCMLVGAVGASIGQPARRVHRSIALGSMILLAAGFIHGDKSLMLFALPIGASAVMVSNLVAYTYNKRQSAQTRFESLLDGIHAFVVENDCQTGEILYANHSATVLRSRNGYADGSLYDLVHPEDRERVERQSRHAMASRTPLTTEVRLCDQDRTIEMEMRTTFTEVGGQFRMRSILFDIAARKRVERELAHRAFHDTLTGLANRAHQGDRLEHALRRAVRSETGHAFLLLDLDNFKDVNDGFGHATGDALLVEIARRLGSVLRKGDTLARLGGDEFAVLLEDTDLATAREVAERMRAEIGQQQSAGGLQVFSSVSIGLSLFPLHAETPEDLMRTADVAMYHAKRTKTGLAVYNATMNPESARRLTMAAELHTAITDSQLRVFFQPIVDGKSGTLASCEALVRWEHPTRGLIAPTEFVPVAHAAGLSVELARAVTDLTLSHLERWQSLGIALPVSINLSATDLIDVAFIDWFIGQVRTRGIRTDLVTIELTEIELVAHKQETHTALLRLREAGISSAVDDFGTGYSSLSWLRDLPVSTLKVDRSFVEAVCTDERALAIVQSTVQLANSLNLKVIGEGVENRSTADVLSAMGCDSFQGFLYGRAVNGSVFEAILQERSEEPTAANISG